MQYAVQAAAFNAAIHVGRLSKNGAAFLHKEDATDMVLASVAQYVKRNFDGAMQATFPRMGLSIEVKVTTLAPSLTVVPDAEENPS